MKVLVLGSGAREHALVRAMAADPEVDAIDAAPGNPGIDATALCVDIDILDGEAVAELAAKHEVDLVVVGPEAPLVAGGADVCRGAGLAVCGPSAAAARLEDAPFLTGVRFVRPAASRKRATRSVGWAPTPSQCLALSTFSFTRSGLSFLSMGSNVPICSM